MIVWWAIYSFLAANSALNFLFLKRPRANGVQPFLILIPARDEEFNLQRLLPPLLAQGAKVVVFDDASSDRTAEIARAAGATVIQSSKELPAGWTGKNRASKLLADYALADNTTDWMLFLDADTVPSGDFVAKVSGLIESARAPIITGMPQIIPGKGLEPLVMFWVGWIILATNPFWIVNLTGIGHNRFLNGQFHLWRKDVYEKLQPNDNVKGRIMEDVMMARHAAKGKIPVETVIISSILRVHMYQNFREAFDGMSKNSFEITNHRVGNVLLAFFLFTLAWAWMYLGTFALGGLALLLVSGIFVQMLAKMPLIWAPTLPISISLAAVILIRSMVWHATGKVRWKGRTYDPK